MVDQAPAPGDRRPPRTAALLGAGVIGAGWAARMLLAGVDVRLYDPSPDAEGTVAVTLERARRAWAALTDAPLPPEGALTVHPEPAEAVAGAQLIQESAPERESLKRDLLRAAGHAADPGALIASSTSGLLPSRLMRDLPGPERFVVGHPFNPVYLLPLVEVCGSPQTSPDAIRRAADTYRSLGMRPLVLRHEIDGFIADRLLEALWREGLWLVAEDVATVTEVDDAIRFGAGLRWAAMGTFLTYRLAGGPGGMRHFLGQFGPALELPWTRLTDVPRLDQRLLDELVSQSDAQAGGLSIDELTRIRDDCLVAVLRGLRDVGWGAGETLARTEQALVERARRDLGHRSAGRGASPTGDEPPPADPSASAPDTPGADGHDPRLFLHEVTVLEEWIDYNEHLTESRYLEVLADATDAFLRRIGIVGEYIKSGRSYFTVETHIRHLAQARRGERLFVATRLLEHDAKRLRLFHELYRRSDGQLLATGEHLLLHVDGGAGRSAPAGKAVLAALAEVREAQASLAWPDAAGAGIQSQATAPSRATPPTTSAAPSC